ncbi:hypothetical protein T10_10664, partial [Trichinella papuae]
MVSTFIVEWTAGRTFLRKGVTVSLYWKPLKQKRIAEYMQVYIHTFILFLEINECLQNSCCQANHYLNKSVSSLHLTLINNALAFLKSAIVSNFPNCYWKTLINTSFSKRVHCRSW